MQITFPRPAALFVGLALVGSLASAPARSADTLKGTFRGPYVSDVSGTGGNMTFKVTKYNNVPNTPETKVLKGEIKIGKNVYKGAGIFLTNAQEFTFTGFYKKGRKVFNASIGGKRDEAGVLSGTYVLANQGNITDQGTIVLQR